MGEPEPQGFASLVSLALIAWAVFLAWEGAMIDMVLASFACLLMVPSVRAKWYERTGVALPKVIRAILVLTLVTMSLLTFWTGFLRD